LSVFLLASLLTSVGAKDGSELLPQGLEVTVSIDQPKVFTHFRRNEITPPTIRMTLRVFNSFEHPIILPFASGQKFDFLICDADDRLVWRWSEGKFFTMALTELTIGPGESKTFDASYVFVDKEGNPMPEGLYTVVGKLAVPSRKIEGTTQFSHSHQF
jgi:hypothetical protein